MGYTHYWKISPHNLQAKQLRIEDVTRAMLLILTSDHDIPIELQVNNGGHGTGLSIVLDGKGDNAHESFCWPPRLGSEPQRLVSDFCKTAQKPYDTLVCACLTVARHMLGDALIVTSDGEAYDWRHGVRLARAVLGTEAIANPFGELPEPELTPRERDGLRDEQMAAAQRLKR